MKHRTISIFLLAALALPLLAGCASTPPATSSPAATAVSVTQPAATAVSAPAASTAVSATAPAAQPAVAAATLAAYAKVLSFNNAAWKFDAANNVYWQIGLQYSLTPETKDYETLGIYVPGAYLTAKDNGDGTYTAALNPSGSLNGFTAKTAPMVYPVSTPGYSAQKAPTAYNYDDVSSYLKAGFIYVYPGMRGKANGYDANKKLTYSGGAPWGVTDLKAAVRYIRYNQAVLPGNTASMFVFGMSGGGAQSSVMGASGDSPLYTPYLQSIGAAMADANGAPLSDAISGVMAWCPITSLDYADEAYEWNMGQYVSTGTRATTTWTSALSKDLASAYADYINKLGLKDQNGSALLLESSSTGIYTSGSYAAYLKTSIEQSLNNFLADTKFPYTATSGGFPGGGPQGGAPVLARQLLVAAEKCEINAFKCIGGDGLDKRDLVAHLVQLALRIPFIQQQKAGSGQGRLRQRVLQFPAQQGCGSGNGNSVHRHPSIRSGFSSAAVNPPRAGNLRGHPGSGAAGVTTN